ncbi:lipase [Daedaleopsis nitida]|nr:lipase [Daedaleopsis nitida]
MRLPVSHLSVFLAVCSALAVAVAFPLEVSPREEDAGDILPLTRPQISSFKPYSFFAASAYCLPEKTITWSCGHHCDANPNFKPIAAGGDGILVEFWYVGFDPDLGEVIVAHQGTDVLTIVPLLTDADTLPLPLDPHLFPGVPPLALVHNGFALEQLATHDFILTAVKNAMQEFNTTKVTTVGHSLGAAISLLDAIFLRLHVPEATVRFVGYGLPRVGDLPFVNWVDSLGIEVNHIANKKDLVPVLPPVLLTFRQISGEIHIDEVNQWISCPGHDRVNLLCTAGDANILLDFNLFDHPGPYDGVLMFCLL